VGSGDSRSPAEVDSTSSQAWRENLRQSNNSDVGLFVAAKGCRGAPESVRYAVGAVFERRTDEPARPIFRVAIVEAFDDMPARNTAVEAIVFKERQSSVLDAGIQQLRDLLYVSRYDS
jgi:hypothetical protein